MDKAAREVLMARDIIAAFLAELLPRYSREQHEHNAASILDRLSNNNPPLLVMSWPGKGEQ